MEQKLYVLLSDVLKEPIEHITDESSPENVKNWDSFNGLVLVDRLEKDFEIKFTLDEVMDVKNVSDIKRHLRTHGIAI